MGAVLVTTLIVLTVLAVVAVAFMQSSSIDQLSSRSVTRSYQAQLAAEAGLGEALALLNSNLPSFSYISGGEPAGNTYRTFIRPTTNTGGVWAFSGPAAYLDSGVSGNLATLLVSGTNTNVGSGVTVRVSYKELLTNATTTNRYAFWVDEAGAKQNLSWWGQGTTRGFLTNIGDLELLLPLPDGSGSSAMPATVKSWLATNRSYVVTNTNLFTANPDPNARMANTTIVTTSNSLLTVASLNLLDPASMAGRATRYFFTLSSPSSAATPAWGRKLNLSRLSSYISNSLTSTAQGTGPNTRTELVEQLLSNNPTAATNWGGGTLSWLTNKYTATECRQIAANLVDYLDSDLIPTTDSTNAPTYFGVESRADSAGNVQGHPFINFVSTGLVFNRSSAASAQGQLNSTLVLCSFGMVYPWTSSNAPPENYTPEIRMRVEGSVVNGIPSVGTNAESYFAKDLTEQINARPISSRFTPFTGQNWPQVDGMAGNASYAGRMTTNNWGNQRGPSNITFNISRIVIESLLLRFTPTGGGASGYVQIVPAGQTMTIVPSNIVAGGGLGSLIVKFTDPAYNNSTNIYLSSDPRSGFQSASWTALRSSNSFGTNIPPPFGGPTAINITSGVDGTNWDTAQGMPVNFLWYTNTNAVNHLSRSVRPFESIGEIGYLWTGKPWQTLNLTRTNSPTNADWNLLDYLSAGYVQGTNNINAMPLQAPTQTGIRIVATNSLLQEGGFNLHTRKLATAQAFLTGAQGVAGFTGSNIATAPPAQFPGVGGALASLTAIAPNSAKFLNEGLVRAAANASVTQSRIFTVYSRGEVLSGRDRSVALLEADVFVDVNPATGRPSVRVISKSFR